uniref:ATP synthase F0 subunit 8 n=1 Tax=Libellula quadrimaculata TaxID=70395 RepID=UPI001EDFDAAE|nr:ATP synthase F0 subunit 8 [Libellula quadrimaculata]UIB40243.1 ATP synthase F0 subunit 8 [Libellula quadrimaculata]
MPQMAPMSWILLFLFFSFMLLMINMLNYYLFNPSFKISKESKNMVIKNNNWKW